MFLAQSLLSTSLLGILLAVIACPAHGNLVRVYLQGGQSNADGRALSAFLPASLQQPQTDVDFFFRVEGSHPWENQLINLQPGSPESNPTNFFGPEITFGRSMADFYASDPNTSVAIIKYANGGTNLHTNWKADKTDSTTGDGNEYTSFQNTVSAGLAAIQSANPEDTVIVSGMIWHQGESDSKSAINANAYEANLIDFIADIRATYSEDLPFIIGEIANNGANSQMVREAQKAISIADPLTRFVSTDGYGLNFDNLHFNASGQQLLGWDFALQIQSVPEPNSPTIFGLFMLAFIGIVKRRKRKPFDAQRKLFLISGRQVGS